ncbi:hypothetical protein KBZ75_30125 [Streptomyces sp. RK76]|nr:hypothetical protein [Streptomyces sp. RK76]
MRAARTRTGADAGTESGGRRGRGPERCRSGPLLLPVLRARCVRGRLPSGSCPAAVHQARQEAEADAAGDHRRGADQQERGLRGAGLGELLTVALSGGVGGLGLFTGVGQRGGTLLLSDVVVAAAVGGGVVAATGVSAVAAGLVTAGLVAAGLVTAGLVAAGLVTARLVAARLVTAGLVTAGLVATRLVATRLVTAGLVTAGLVTARLVTAGLVTAGLVAARLVTAGLVTTRLVTAGLVTTRLVTAGLVTTRLVTAGLVTTVLVAARLASGVDDDVAGIAVALAALDGQVESVFGAGADADLERRGGTRGGQGGTGRDHGAGRYARDTDARLLRHVVATPSSRFSRRGRTRGRDRRGWLHVCSSPPVHMRPRNTHAAPHHSECSKQRQGHCVRDVRVRDVCRTQWV